MTASDPGRPPRARRRSRGSIDDNPRGAHGVSPAAIARAARKVPRTVLHELDEHPTAVLATVAGASFVAGAVVGSRLGRALLVALAPVGLRYAMSSGVADGAREWLEDVVGRVSPEHE